MIWQLTATQAPTRTVDQTQAAGGAGIRRRQVFWTQARTVPTGPRCLTHWLTVGRVVAWVCLVIVIGIAAGRALQLTAANVASRAEASEQAPPADNMHERGACPALDQYLTRTMTIDELHDIQDTVCPQLDDPRRAGI